ncbi:mitochondrial exoribonuclease DSS-1 [Perkinsela sp. CCAP 1560/4]|nr:mitochondrial exoribonuclease DSS-1 [Perkinsela sp. CCAP 1560/4]|eukprot:KNH09002.1 mitochondrial exoribonuclease DSS-1 [Perkinsela sp. CCAP 1560/4]
MKRKLNWPFYIKNHVLQKFRSANSDQQEAVFRAEKRLALGKLVTTDGAKDFNPTIYDRHLLNYVIGDSFISQKDISFMHSVLNPILASDPDTQSPTIFLRAMEHTGFIRSGDNVFRRRIEGQLRLPKQTHILAQKCAEKEDALRAARKLVERNVYAIDSKSTFEVDDGISFEIDSNGREFVTVHVADVTSFCSIDSPLDRLSGMKLRTTTYLPEGVWCMLPRKLVDVATLQPEHPCRTFDITFAINNDGDLNHYDVGVSTVTNLRRLTYDVCQEIIKSNGAKGQIPPSAPSWMTSKDVLVISRLNELRLIRKEFRLKKGCMKIIKPKPRIVVSGVNTEDPIVIHQKGDESISLRDAYNFVEEFMIAANEACSRIAIEQKLSIPFRVTRPLSNRHEEINTALPHGAVEILMNSKTVENEQIDLFKLAKSIASDNLLLKSVTRAYYSAQIGFHSFLNTSLYCHATSPLRRYADMLVHHQLKSYIAARSKIHHHTLQTIDPITMREECQKTSKVTGDVRVLDNQSSYFWAFKNLENQKKDSPNSEVLAIVVSTIRMDASPSIQLLEPNHAYASQIVLCELLLAVMLYHDEPRLAPGDFVSCTVCEVDPVRLALKLSLDRVVPETEVKSCYNLKDFTEGFSAQDDI